MDNDNRLCSLAEEVARLWSRVGDEALAQTRKMEFHRTLESFLTVNSGFAGAQRLEQLLRETRAVMEADQKRRRVRTLEDILTIAAERLSMHDLEQAARRDWSFAIKRFLADHPIYEADSVLLDALDATVRMLASDPNNASRDSQWFLTEAHSAVSAKFPERMRAGRP
jgi:hypothetical protein